MITLNKILAICSSDPLDCTNTCHYKNALVAFLTLLNDFYSMFMRFFIRQLKFYVFMFAMPIAQAN
jgi:hypothetical protein